MRTYLRRACFAMLTSTALLHVSAEEALPPLASVGEQGVVSAEFIFALEGRPTPQCHASTIVETPAGMVAAWFAGTREKDQDVGIWLSRQENGTWQPPVELVDGSEGESKEYPCWNPVLFQPAEGPLLLFYKVGPSPSSWWGMLMTSQDNGKTWSEPHRLGTSEKLGEENPNLIGPVKNKPIQLSSGALLAPSSTEHDGWRVHFEKSDDRGKTWQVIGPINDASRFDAIQPSILEHGDGRLQILCRTQQGEVAESWSRDGGKTWSPLAGTGLPNPNSGTDAVTLADGRHVLVYNHTVKRGDFPAGRTMLNVAVSEDGKTWQPVVTLERSKGEYSYPAVIQAEDGKVHITYTWHRETVKHVVLDPDAFSTSASSSGRAAAAAE